ncbi:MULTISPECIES: glycogen debranching protein GlgX [unclassified Nocardioides]|uniref:glycogen debranching protein GlgX n=1 Tax=unclassified Nocardioides TaxID=2615069 RepID=UPI0009F0241A|nr:MULTISPECIES: glycogen debranching protein GlgX [unclassified Nocardioides]GAW50016.1 glycogen debranching protein GlgX [Nocardioides sp. PD653-B2]GAW55891.1 glycogen debranching protein GlgX [Nocardioides sp. PD653]
MSPGIWTHLGQQTKVWPGRNYPLGATWSAESTNFAVYAPNATECWLCLFDDEGVETRHQLTERSLGIWHGALPDIAPGTRYGYRVDGPWDPELGYRFNPYKLLLDPYAQATSGTISPGPALFGYDQADPTQRDEQDSAPHTARSVVVDPAFDWDGETPIRRRWLDSVVYELHVKGFTKLHDRVPEELRGTYAGLGSPAVVEYLRDLGVTAVELLPVQQFFSEPALLERGLVNYWGYNTISYFSPDAGYSSSGDRGQQVTEFKQMVKSLHAAGIEVILDVVYNHTAEGGSTGPTLSFRGLDDRGFYKRVLPKPDPVTGLPVFDDTYWDVTGCGNTVDSNDPLALRLILDSLRYWVTEMHIDGFRFDLMSALTRTGYDIDMNCRLLVAIGQDPVLRHVKLIAEPWDASMDGYLVGRMPPPWVEWNDQYRDTIRDFWRNHSSGIRTVATRLAGSSDLYADDGRSAYNSINFVTAHDGFTVRDLVTYEHKHNEANGEDNRDGTDNNRSWNLGLEGETNDLALVAVRRRQAANIMATLCLSNGVPMITAGDERGRTQRGNNNAYAQDNETSWVDWRPDDAWLDVYETVKTALRLRREHPALRQRHWFEGRPTIRGGPKDLAWLHPTGREMTPDDWHDHDLRAIGMFVSGAPLREPGPQGQQQVDKSFMLWFNSDWLPQRIELPENDWVQTGEVVLSTDFKLPVGTVIKAGDRLSIGRRTVVVIRQV